MKNKIILGIAATGICFLTACGGDRTPQNGKGDTVKNSYSEKPIGDSSKVDTAKIKSPDNSASGGTSALKDTTVKKK